MRTRLIAGGVVIALGWSASAAASDSGLRTFADIGALGIPLAAGAITIYEHDRPGLLQLGETAALGFGVTEALKYGIDERRPNGGHLSFPSGHTSLAFSGAGYLHARYGWKVGLPFELLAAGVAYSRVKTHDHHWYDVVAGAAIGEGSAFLLTHRLDDKARLSFGGDSHGGAVAFAMRF